MANLSEVDPHTGLGNFSSVSDLREQVFAAVQDLQPFPVLPFVEQDDGHVLQVLFKPGICLGVTMTHHTDEAESPNQSVNSPSIPDIIHETALEYKLGEDGVADILSSARVRGLVAARHMGMYVARRTTPLSLPEIAKGFNRKDHTSIIYAVEKVKGLINHSPGQLAHFANVVKALGCPLRSSVEVDTLYRGLVLRPEGFPELFSYPILEIDDRTQRLLSVDTPDAFIEENGLTSDKLWEHFGKTALSLINGLGQNGRVQTTVS